MSLATLAALPVAPTVGQLGIGSVAQAGSEPVAAVLFAALGLPFLGALVVLPLYRVLGERVAYVAAAVALASFGLVASQYGAEGTVSVPWIPTFDVSLTLYLDGLSLLIALLASGIGVLIFTYSGSYMHDEPGQARYYATLLAFMGSMLGVALASDLISLFVFWELTSITSFGLIGHYRDDASSLYAARKSMLITVSGGLFMLVGFLLLNYVSGEALTNATFTLVGTPDSLIANADAIRAALRETGLFVPVLGLIAIGAAAKSAQVPFHLWLPNAMEAPTPVSAFLHSATMVKAGVYLIGRVRPLLVGEEWMLLFGTLGLVTMTVTALLAVGASDIKELLAYSTASHLGLITAGFGFANQLGAETGVFHILNHALFKATLFLVAGIVAHEAGTRAIDELGGLRHDLPITAVITAIAALGMAGLPPFNGFYSKELLFEAAYEVAHTDGGLMWLYPIVAVVGSVFTFLYSIRFLWLFMGEKPAGLGEVHSPPALLVAPPAVLAALAAVVGIDPQLAVDTIVQSAFEGTVAGEAHTMSVHLPTELKPAVVMSAITIAVGIAASPFYDRIRDGVRWLSRGPLSANWYYDGAVDGLEHASALSLPRVQTGYFRTYAIWTLAATSLLALGGYLAAGVSLPPFTGLSIALPVVIVLAVAVIGAAAVGVAPSHVAGVLTLSVLGFMIALFYVLSNAPDLALTQLAVETLVLVLFLLVLDKLPAFYGDLNRSRAIRDGVLATGVGATVFTTVLVATAASPNDVIAEFLIERAPVPKEHGPLITEFGGGGNIVNVILVDFRAFDTMGEIAVVAMAALSVLTLIAMRGRGESS
ncbi:MULTISPECIES: hydrogen gas-evolving membrane-bound hydrogenase subunit E [Halococcus]|uniref:NADH:ubiquinone oxidoreductase subunit 5 (Chain l)/multisubunit na+/h+ antiporter, mnha subunit n=1 Tax=Halococcus salifodinae DSM 8989 TaxID=1227456 RepID=M0MWL1_9EURY|nr:MULTISPECIES: hydrogen gas-evolving membrane-bound hydrogenase subunit E [Halococcus]EMA50112.1 NADH:ubiquinone oxidoreductase subunit 5 (chain l)/multisubunit na+/h+ antiporter, mnha subunit [Halococcus salifodinae DSM 8989]